MYQSLEILETKARMSIVINKQAMALKSMPILEDQVL
jgi:hypothetical protein